jgi:hypothetical protein
MVFYFLEEINVRSSSHNDHAFPDLRTDKQVFPSLEFIGWYSVAQQPTARHIALHHQVHLFLMCYSGNCPDYGIYASSPPIAQHHFYCFSSPHPFQHRHPMSMRKYSPSKLMSPR